MKPPALAAMVAGLKQAKAPPNVMLGFVLLACRSGSLPHMPTFAPAVLSDAALADIAARIWSFPPPPAPPKQR
ncbi:MAG: hypothetical protein HY321_09450 [Armatimonadetes bacterium]|nr:hypothetical protein [Armatimonadota bacterium]